MRMEYRHLKRMRLAILFWQRHRGQTPPFSQPWRARQSQVRTGSGLWSMRRSCILEVPKSSTPLDSCANGWCPQIAPNKPRSMSNFCYEWASKKWSPECHNLRLGGLCVPISWWTLEFVGRKDPLKGQVDKPKNHRWWPCKHF
jgi:hypothetical protein